MFGRLAALKYQRLELTCVLHVLAAKCLGVWPPPNTSAAVQLALMGPFDYINWCESSLTLSLKRLELTCVLRVLAAKCLGAWPPPNTSAAVQLALMGPFDYVNWCESSLTLCLKRLELTCVLRVSAVKCLGAWPPPNTSARLYSSP